MIKKISELEKMILLSTSFTLALVIVRFLITKEEVYFFYPWNLFLATIPLLFSRQLKKYEHISIPVILRLACWLLFFPNAPYIITDLFHFELRPPVPYWFDLLIVMSGAWNGLTLCFMSLMQVERFLEKHLKMKWVAPCTVALLLLGSYGIYLGRYQRYNSWDIVTKPGDVLRTIATQIAQPWQHLQVWAFTILFTFLLGVFYFTIKKIPAVLKKEL
jgi:uncharacterized membrane protein